MRSLFHLGGAARPLLLLALATCVAGFALAQQSQSEQDVSAELRALYEADQADREFSSPPPDEHWPAMVERDRQRRDRVHELMRADLLRSGDDFYHAAMVLQHGEGSEDILLAHILATAAGFRGHERARWLSAAALDRYLHRTRQPQRLGTQYVKAAPEAPFDLDPAAPWSQGAYERWLPDTIREAYGVKPLAEQEARLEQMRQ